MNKKCIIVLVGPSGSGKTTVGDALSDKGIPKLVTTTTRKPREGELGGVDYYFREPDELNPDDFIEQTVYNQRIYGLTKNEVKHALEKYDKVHVSLDKNGAKAMKQAYPEETVIVFMYVPLSEMVKRMTERGDSEQKISERVDFSQETNELKPIEEADLIIENRSIEETVDTILHYLKKRASAPTE